MNTQTIAIAAIALIIGATGGYLAAGDKAPEPVQHSMHDMNAMEVEMDGMMANLSGKSGDAFDQAFLADMIVHHEGAVQMAEAAKLNAAHPELKVMAVAIISAQTDEIEQMKQWQQEWYGH